MTNQEMVEALRKSSVARYLQLATLFRGKIEAGIWAVNAKIPTVEDLAKQCGVATMTIRQALNILEAEGLIERYRAKGTFIKAKPKKDIWCEVQTNWSGLLIARANADIEIMNDQCNRQLPPIDLQDGTSAESYRHLKRCHSREGIRFLLADIYIDESLDQYISAESYTSMTAMRLVSDIPNRPIKKAWQQLTISSADLETSGLLNIPIGTAVAQVQRVALDQNNKVLLIANGIYRGDMVRVDFKLR